MKKKILLTLAVITAGLAAARADEGFSVSFGTYQYTPRHCFTAPAVVVAPVALCDTISQPVVIETPVVVVTPSARHSYNCGNDYNPFERRPRDASYQIEGQNSRPVHGGDPWRGAWTYD